MNFHSAKSHVLYAILGVLPLISCQNKSNDSGEGANPDTFHPVVSSEGAKSLDSAILPELPNSQQSPAPAGPTRLNIGCSLNANDQTSFNNNVTPWGHSVSAYLGVYPGVQFISPNAVTETTYKKCPPLAANEEVVYFTQLTVTSAATYNYRAITGDMGNFFIWESSVGPNITLCNSINKTSGTNISCIKSDPNTSFPDWNFYQNGHFPLQANKKYTFALTAYSELTYANANVAAGMAFVVTNGAGTVFLRTTLDNQKWCIFKTKKSNSISEYQSTFADLIKSCEGF